MAHCARLRRMHVTDGTLHLGLRSGDRDVAVQTPLPPGQAHALRHLHAGQRIRIDATGRDPQVDLLRSVATAAGGAVTALVVDLTGETPTFRLRVGSAWGHDEVEVRPVDVVLLLAGGGLPLEVVTPTPPADWDAALAELVAEQP